MRSAECGIAMRGRSPIDAPLDTPHSAFRIPHFLVSWPVMHLNQLLQRLDPPLPRPPDQRPQDVSGGEGIPEGAMACWVLDAEERRHVVEPTVAQLGHEAAREADRAEGLAARCGDAGRDAFGTEEAPVEAGVVGDEHAGVERVSETCRHVHETGATGDQAVGDAGEARYPRRNRGPRVEQRLEAELAG